MGGLGRHGNKQMMKGGRFGGGGRRFLCRRAERGGAESRRPGSFKGFGLRLGAWLGLLPFLLSWLFLLPAPLLQAQMSSQASDYRFSSVLIQLHVLRNGSVKAACRLDLKSGDKELKTLKLELPYYDGQSAAFEQLKIAEIDAEGRSVNAIGEPIGGEISQNSRVGAYKVTDSGKALQLSLNSSVPKSSERRIDFTYTLYPDGRRYRDVSDLRLKLFETADAVPIDRMGLLLSYEANTLADEEKDFRLFQRDNAERSEPLLRPISPLRAGQLWEAGKSGLLPESRILFAYYGTRIPPRAGIRIRLISPSIWTPLQREEPGRLIKLPGIIQDEEAYRQDLIRRYDYRGKAAAATWAAMGAAVLLFVIFHWYGIFNLYRPAKRGDRKPPADMPPPVMAFLRERKVSGPVVISTIYGLAEKGFLALDEKTVYRVPERLLPDETALPDYEQVILHWLWELMQGSDQISLEEMDSRLAAEPERAVQVMFRVRNLLDVYCADQHWVPLPGEQKPKLNHLVTAGVYVLLMLLLCQLGNFLMPLLLLLPAAVFAAAAFVSVKYTNEGYKMLGKLRNYEHYLSEIDRQGLDEETMLLELDRHFQSALALGTVRPFLLNLRYVVSVETLLASGFLRRYGYKRLQNTMERFMESRGGMSASNIRSMHSYLAKEIGKNTVHLDTAGVRLNFKLFRENVLERG